MKKLHLLLIGLLLSVGSIAQENNPVVLTIDGDDIRASEFLYIYSKNNEDPSFAKDSLADYMELFINYKLKVKEAQAKQYDTIPRLVAELAQYRKQLSLPYMTDKTKNEKLIEEAYARTTNEVRASHILIRLKGDPSPADTAEAYSRTMALRAKIVGGESFEAVAKGKGGSEDPSVKSNNGDLGYFSALQMVYPFEQAAFSTAVGEVSMPVRTRFGYHLIKVIDNRPAQGMIETAHILVLADDKAADDDKMKAEKKINEIYALLQAGDKFEDLAAKYSDDKSSSAKGGLLPLFGSGAKQRMVPEFEKAAFAIANDGDYSAPVKTTFGYHIIKRMQVIPIPEYDVMYRELKLRVERDMRAETTKEAFIEDLKKQYAFQTNAQKLLPYIFNAMGDEIFMGAWKGMETPAHDDDVLFTFKDNMATLKDMEAYIIKQQSKMRRVDKQMLVEDHYNAMVKEWVVNYEDSQLETKYPEFKSLIQEYADGILVFEIMQDEIWKKASKDTTGIKNYYDSHNADFTYNIRYKGDLYTAKDKATAASIVELIKVGELDAKQIIEKLNHDSELNAKVRNQVYNSETTEAFKVRKSLKVILPTSGLTDEKAIAKIKAKNKKSKAKNAKYKLKTFKNGLNKPYKNADVYYVFDVEETMQPRKREFSEARGLVTAAYQNQLEKEWIEALRKKYAIKIHEDALYGLGGK
ncbi:MAG: peptidyl-prolyl cis-trans isomerase SurA [Crocinitomix sp.]|jgi:peptidyl-prolyl cis-trans isomerase SurA